MRVPYLVLGAPFAAALLLAGCDVKESDGGNTSVTLGGGEMNLTSGTGGKAGEVKIDVPGFQAKVKLPGIKIDADDFDMNGVKLYPGSTISGMNVMADNDKGGGDGTVTVAFDSPAAPDAVAAWFQKELTGVGYTLTRAGNALTGTTEEKKPFSLTLDPAAAGHSGGKIVIGG